MNGTEATIANHSWWARHGLSPRTARQNCRALRQNARLAMRLRAVGRRMPGGGNGSSRPDCGKPRAHSRAEIGAGHLRQRTPPVGTDHIGRRHLSSIRYHCLRNMMMRTLLPAALFTLAVLAGSACGRRAEPGTLSIAAASDLQFALADASRQFHQAHPRTEVRIDYGSSGNFYAQIRNGAPFDLFLSADVQYPRSLAADGLVRADAVFVYAVGRLAVWVPAASPLDPATALRDPSVRRVAIANPAHAPYGRAAEAALRQMGLYDSVARKLVLGENISQTLQFVQSGAADVGLVALSLAIAPTVRGQGRYWEVPLDAYPKMEQGGVILKDSAAARDFRAWLLAPAGRRLLKQYGFSLPGE